MKKILNTSIKLEVLLFTFFLFTSIVEGQNNPLLTFGCPSPTVTIEKCSLGFRPTKDGEVIITAKVEEPIYIGKFRFTLFNVSDEPGYCLNAPATLPASGEHSDTWKDLRFVKGQTGFNVYGPHDNIAETDTDNLNRASVIVKANDFGAYGKIMVHFITGNDDQVLIGFEEGGTTNTFTSIPRDENGNFIADIAHQDTGPGGSSLPGEDIDRLPIGARGSDGLYINGDNFSRYEEYRGFLVGGLWTSLEVNEKDLFIRNKDVPIPGAGFIGDNLTAPVHMITAAEYDPYTRVVNRYSETGHYADQQAIVVEVDQLGGSWGRAAVRWPGQDFIPNNQRYCRVDIEAIRGNAELKFDIGTTDYEIELETKRPYRFSGGKTKIIDPVNGNEDIYFGSYDPKTLEYVTRPMPSFYHKKGTSVLYFFDSDEFINIVFSHEVGHLINLQHNDRENIMHEFINAGAYMNNGYWTNFSSILRGEFRLK
ncbi:MAG: hypothetical protein AAGG75_05455 [Bacteroidota bacterium]